MTDMSEIKGFAADWLALREPADHASRNAEVQAAFLAHMAALTGEAVIVDMGAGTGSTARALAPAIAKAKPELRQNWVLVDADSQLIDRARLELSGLIDQGIGVAFEQANLADRSALDGYMARADVVTGSALIDLVSAEWLDWMAHAAAQHRTAVLFALNYSGTETWSPPHAADHGVLQAFLADQRRDKGFGRALGPDATDYLAQKLAGAFTVTRGTSDWHLERADRPLIEALATGIADGIAAHPEPTADARDGWLTSRKMAESVMIGHEDIFARPV